MVALCVNKKHSTFRAICLPTSVLQHFGYSLHTICGTQKAREKWYALSQRPEEESKSKFIHMLHTNAMQNTIAITVYTFRFRPLKLREMWVCHLVHMHCIGRLDIKATTTIGKIHKVHEK